MSHDCPYENSSMPSARPNTSTAAPFAMPFVCAASPLNVAGSAETKTSLETVVVVDEVGDA